MKSSKYFAAAAVLVAVTTIVANGVFATGGFGQSAPPKPGPEHKWMDDFVGRWTGEGDYKASPFGPASKLTYTEDAEWAPGGFFLVMHYWGGKDPKGEGKGGLTIMGYNAEKKVYFSRTFDAGTGGEFWRGPGGG